MCKTYQPKRKIMCETLDVIKVKINHSYYNGCD